MSDNDSPAAAIHDEEEDRDERSEAENGNGAGADSDQDDDDEGGGGDSDALSEIDEDQFEDYDPSAHRIDEKQKPVDIDEDVARTLKASKRKGLATAPKKPKEGRRDKKKKRDREDDDVGSVDGEILSGKRVRKAPVESPKASPEPENEENLTPEERRRRAIERASRKEAKKPGKRRKRKDEDDLENELDDQLAELIDTMAKACQADNAARENGQPANHKLKLLPKVMGMLNRNNQQAVIVDPESNFLQSVKFFLEPLNDGSLPAFSIQREIFTALTKLPIEKESLIASGIGKVVLFYTKSKKPTIEIKRMAERLVGEWSRPILKRTDDYKKRFVETREFDYHEAKMRQAAGSQLTLTQRPAAQISAREAERERILAPNLPSNRARVVGLPQSYSIAPKSTFDPNRAPEHRPVGAGGAERFRKLTQKKKSKA